MTDRTVLYDQLIQSFQPSPIQRTAYPLFEQHKLNVWIKRDDLIHPVISGNKWRKLKYVLRDVIQQESPSLTSMGGAWSNHLHALAFAARAIDLPCFGLIRNPYTAEDNPTLRDLKRWGMQIEYLSREDFRRLRTHFDDYLPNELTYWIPEGGMHPLARQGLSELTHEIIHWLTQQDFQLNHILLPCGTGTTVAGLLHGIATAWPQDLARPHVHAFAALKNADYLESEITQLASEVKPQSADSLPSWTLVTDQHFGGFGKIPPQLCDFMQGFTESTGIPLDPIYTGKLVAGLCEYIHEGHFAPNENLLLIHTGGLQGGRSLTRQYL